MSVILLFVLAGDPASEAASSAIAASTADGRAGHDRIELERVTSLPSDDEALRRASVASASAVVEVSWPDADGRRAHLHAHLRPSGAWVDRDVTFEAASLAWERGRAVGLAIAAMVPEESAAESSTVIEASPAAPTPSPPEAPPPKPAPVIETTSPLRPATAPIDVRPPLPRPPSRVRFEAGLVGEFGPSFQIESPRSGGRLDATAWLMGAGRSRIGVRVEVGARFATVADTNLDARVARVDGGLGLVLRVVGDEANAFLLRGAIRVVREEVTRTRIDGTDERLGRTLPTGAFFAEGTFALAPQLRALLGLGGELALGATSVAVDGSSRADLPRFALVAELGARWAF